MIDMELVAGPSPAGPDPRAAHAPRHGPEPRRLLPGPRGVQPFYDAVPGIVQKTMDKFAKLIGRQYHLFDYVGAPDAERVIVHHELRLRRGRGDGREAGGRRARRSAWSRSGSTAPSTPRPSLAALPKTVKKIAVLDRTKEPGAAGEPLYQDVITALAEDWADAGSRCRKVIGGRYGLSSQGIHPGQVAARLRRADARPQPKQPLHRRHQRRRDPPEPRLRRRLLTEADDVTRAVFFGLGSDGTVSANRNSVKIVGENTPLHAQGYFVYDSRKAGSVTTSHLRFSPRPIKGSYLVHKANFVACHQFHFLERIDMLSMAEPGATFLLNSPYGPGRGLGPPARRGAEADHRQEAEVLRGRRLPRGPRGADGRADQHDHADLLLQAGRHPPARGGHRADQGRDQEDLRQEGRRARSSSGTTPRSTAPWRPCTR